MRSASTWSADGLFSCFSEGIFEKKLFLCGMAERSASMWSAGRLLSCLAAFISEVVSLQCGNLVPHLMTWSSCFLMLGSLKMQNTLIHVSSCDVTALEEPLHGMVILSK